MARYDAENLANDLVAILKTNLSTKLTAITAEKGDSLTLSPVDTTRGYFFQSLEKATAAALPVFIFWGLDDPIAKGSSGMATAQEIDFFFILVLQDTAENETFIIRLMRYMRAIREVFEENYTTINRAARISVSSLAPVPIESLNAAGTFKATGVKIRANLA